MIFRVASLLCLFLLLASCSGSPGPQAIAPQRVPERSPSPTLTASTPAVANKITVNLNDPTAATNPVKTFSGDKMTVGQMIAKLGKLKANQDVALLCEGEYNPQYGFLAFDIMHGNQLKPEHSPQSSMTLDSLCWKQAKTFASRQK